MKCHIKLEYRDKEFHSFIEEFSNEQYKALSDLVQNAAEGELTYLTFVGEAGKHYFSEKVLEESIITIVKH